MNTLRRTIVGFFSALMGRSAFSAPPNSKDPASLMRGLRDMALSTPAAKLGFKPTANFPRVFGVVMDWAVGDETVSIVGFADGTASLYASSGGGVIGGQGTTAAREAGSTKRHR